MYYKPIWDAWSLLRLLKNILRHIVISKYYRLILCLLFFLFPIYAQADEMTRTLQQNQENIIELLEDEPGKFLIGVLILAIVLWITSVLLYKVIHYCLKKKTWQDWNISSIAYFAWVLGYLLLIITIQILLNFFVSETWSQIIAYTCINGIWCILLICWQTLSSNDTIAFTYYSGSKNLTHHKAKSNSSRQYISRLHLLGFRVCTWREIIGSLLGYILFFPWYWTAYFITMLAFAYLQIEPTSQIAVQNFLASQGLLRYAIIIMVLVIAPITEEIIFRAFLYGALKHFLPTSNHLAMICSAFIFAIVHSNSLVFFPIFTLGLFLTWIYQRTQCLWLNILVHSFHNAITLFYLIYRFG